MSLPEGLEVRLLLPEIEFLDGDRAASLEGEVREALDRLSQHAVRLVRVRTGDRERDGLSRHRVAHAVDGFSVVHYDEGKVRQLGNIGPISFYDREGQVIHADFDFGLSTSSMENEHKQEQPQLTA